MDNPHCSCISSRVSAALQELWSVVVLQRHYRNVVDLSEIKYLKKLFRKWREHAIQVGPCSCSHPYGESLLQL